MSINLKLKKINQVKNEIEEDYNFEFDIYDEFYNRKITLDSEEFIIKEVGYNIGSNELLNSFIKKNQKYNLNIENHKEECIVKKIIQSIEGYIKSLDKNYFELDIIYLEEDIILNNKCNLLKIKIENLRRISYEIGELNIYFDNGDNHNLKYKKYLIHYVDLYFNNESKLDHIQLEVKICLNNLFLKKFNEMKKYIVEYQKNKYINKLI